MRNFDANITETINLIVIWFFVNDRIYDGEYLWLYKLINNQFINF